jgi:hypothetical protein
MLADSLFLQCAGMRTGSDGILRATGGSIGWIYDEWQANPDFPMPDCASTADPRAERRGVPEFAASRRCARRARLRR